MNERRVGRGGQQRNRPALRYLYLMRHGEAASGRPGSADRDRPLTDAGRGDAVAVGRRLLLGAQVPDGALCSPARRAAETLAAMTEGLGRDLPTRFEPAVYATGAGGLLDLVRDTGADVQRLLLVGHNPAVGELAHVFAGQGSPAGLSQLRQGFRPGMLALFALRCEHWADLHPTHAELRRVVQAVDHDV